MQTMSLGHHKSTIWIWCAATQSHRETEKVHETSVKKSKMKSASIQNTIA